jgi:hypothetical protein
MHQAYRVKIEKIFTVSTHQEWADSKLSRNGGSWDDVSTRKFAGWKVSISKIHPELAKAKAFVSTSMEHINALISHHSFVSSMDENSRKLVDFLMEQPVSALCGVEESLTEDLGYFNFLIAEEVGLPSEQLENCDFICDFHWGSRNRILSVNMKPDTCGYTKFRVYNSKQSHYRKYGFQELEIRGTQVVDSPFYEIVREAFEEALDCEIGYEE